MCFPWFRWRLEACRWEANGVSPRCAGRRLRRSSRAGGYWLIDWMISWRSWRHSRCTWRWRPLSWQLQRGEHLRPAISTLVHVICLRRWPITWIFLARAAGRLRTVCHVEWRLAIKLRSTMKWLLCRRVTVPLRQMILIGVLPKLTLFASGMS